MTAIRQLFAIAKKELVDGLRDRRSLTTLLFSTVLTPALLTQSTADRADAFCATVREQSGSEPARVSASRTPFRSASLSGRSGSRFECSTKSMSRICSRRSG